MATTNPLWIVLGGLVTDATFRAAMRTAVTTSAVPALGLQNALKPLGLPLGVGDLVHVTQVIHDRWGEAEPAILALDKTLTLIDLSTAAEHETAAAIGLMIPDTTFREGLLGAADKSAYINGSAQSPGFPAANVTKVTKFLAENSGVETKIVLLEKTMWHSGAKELVQARCGGSYNLPAEAIFLQQTIFLEQFALKQFGGQDPTTDELVAELRAVGAEPGSGFVVLGAQTPSQ